MNERTRSLETEFRRPSLSSWGEGSMDSRRLTEAAKPLRRGYSDSTMARMRQATGETLLAHREIGGAGNRITGETGKSGTGGRVAEGSVVVEKQSNVCGAKGPCCL